MCNVVASDWVIDDCLVPEMCFICLMLFFDVIQCECMVLCLSVDMWCVSSRGCRSIGAILVFRCRRIVDVVVVVSLSLSLSFCLITCGVSCMFIMLVFVRSWCFECDWS